jgi:hypothetical protein
MGGECAQRLDNLRAAVATRAVQASVFRPGMPTRWCLAALGACEGAGASVLREDPLGPARRVNE